MDDLDALLSSFVKLGTTDHDELVQQFQTIVPAAERDVAAFFLEANNWGLPVRTAGASCLPALRPRPHPRPVLDAVP